MLTLLGLYLVAIAIGAGAAFINDLFFIISLKDHVLKRSEIITLKQLNLIQTILIVWIILTEITFFAIQIQNYTLGVFLGSTVAKLLIEIVVLFCALLLRQVHLPALIRHQNTYSHLSNSFIEHSNSLVGTAVTSLISWFYIVLLTSASFENVIIDFGFGTTIISYIAICLIASWFFILLKNKILHRRKR